MFGYALERIWLVGLYYYHFRRRDLALCIKGWLLLFGLLMDNLIRGGWIMSPIYCKSINYEDMTLSHQVCNAASTISQFVEVNSNLDQFIAIKTTQQTSYSFILSFFHSIFSIQPL
jgi:hypothetical protein